ncbi:MAG: endonuclease III [Bacilli bacterium]|nr:endonuclease III [Bacilli bacterium]
MTKKEKIKVFLNYLDELFPNAHCELNYSKDYELVIAVMLSAQTTDAKVNKITKILFEKYSGLEALANADFSIIEEIIRPLGLSKVKAKNIIGIANALLLKYGGVVPSDKDELQKLPGIGNKSAGVVRAEVFKIQDLPVDTHILRVSKRLDFVDDKADALKTELELKKLIPNDRYIKSHHQIIFFGRYFCLARSPKCSECKLRDFCKEIKK